MALEILSTGFALLFALLAAFMAWQSGKYSESARDAWQRCTRMEARLAAMRGELTGATAALDALDTRIRRVNGRIDQLKRDERAAEPPQPETAEEIRARLRAENGLPRVGPRPKAAAE